MFQKVLIVGVLLLAAFLWGCSDRGNDPMMDDDQEERMTDGGAAGFSVSPELENAVRQALVNEDEKTEQPEPQALGRWGNVITEPTVITQPGFYRVAGDFSAGDDAIVIQSDWVYLSLGRSTLTGPGNKSGRGVVVDGARWVVVRGGKLQMFGMGVVLENSENTAITGVEIVGGDEFADPAHGVAPQIGIMAVNSPYNSIARNRISLINLGIFVRGDGSHGNRVFGNKLVGGDLGLLGICYNPDGSGDPRGAHDDLVRNNYISRFRGGIQGNTGTHDNRFTFNRIEYFVYDEQDVDGANFFNHNRSRQLDMPMHTLTLDFTGLDDLGSDFAYEGWIIVNGEPVSTGVFTVMGGVPSQTHFDIAAFDLAAAAKFVLTIEPSPDSDPMPSSTHYLAGDFMGSDADLMIGDPAALGDDFLGSMGDYILNTPSTGSDDSDYANGIWWLDPTAGPGPTLTLPTLPAGWMYEGWVVGPGGPVTTGTFTSASGFDSDAGGPTAGPDPTPPFPGQDYIMPPMPLIGYAAVITVEPYPDNSPMPFTLKPLVDGSIDDVGIGVLQSMGNNAGSFPTGMAMR